MSAKLHFPLLIGMRADFSFSSCHFVEEVQILQNLFGFEGAGEKDSEILGDKV